MGIADWVKKYESITRSNYSFQKGDIVIDKREEYEQEHQLYLVGAVFGDPEYDAYNFVNSENGFMIKKYNEGERIDYSNITQFYWSNMENYSLYQIKFKNTDKSNQSDPYEYEEPDEPEFDENCLSACKPGEHICGK